MKAIGNRIRKLEDRIFPTRQERRFWITKLPNRKFALDQDRCEKILGECGFLPNVRFGVLNFMDIPDGLNAKELEKYLRTNGAQICGTGRDQQLSAQAPRPRPSTVVGQTRCRWHQMAPRWQDTAKLGRKQEEAIAALLTQRNIEDAARAIGVRTRTLIRWLKLPAFGKEYRKVRREAVHQSGRADAASHGRCRLSRPKAHDRSECARGREASGGRVCFRSRDQRVELEDIEARVAELERAAEAAAKRP